MAQSAAVATDAPQPLGAPDAGFDQFLKSQYDPKIKQASADTQAAYRKAASTIAGVHEAEDRLQPPPMPNMQPPPQHQNTDPIQAWGSLAMGIAMFGSLMTRRPLVNALNAGARVMDAVHAGDDQAFNRALADWHAQTDYAIKMHEYQTELYADSIERLKRKEAGAVDMLKIELGAAGDQTNLAILEAQSQEGMLRNMDRQNAAFQKFQEHTNKMIEAAPAVAFSLGFLKRHPNPETWTPEIMKEYQQGMQATQGKGQRVAGGIEGQELELEKETYRQAHDGQEMPASLERATIKKIREETKPDSPAQLREAGKRADAADQISGTINIVDQVLGSGPNDPKTLIRPATTGIGGRAAEVAQGVAGVAGVDLATARGRFEQNASLVQAQIRNELIKSHYMSKAAIQALDEIVPGLELFDDPVTTRQRWENLRNVLTSEHNRLVKGETVPTDLPDPTGLADGSVAKDGGGTVVGIVRGGKWAAP